MMRIVMIEVTKIDRSSGTKRCPVLMVLIVDDDNLIILARYEATMHRGWSANTRTIPLELHINFSCSGKGNVQMHSCSNIYRKSSESVTDYIGGNKSRWQTSIVFIYLYNLIIHLARHIEVNLRRKSNTTTFFVIYEDTYIHFDFNINDVSY